MYHLWKKADLVKFALAHSLTVLAKDTRASLQERLVQHRCTETCQKVVMQFTTLRACRSPDQVQRAIDSAGSVEDAPHDSASYLTLADDSLKRSIIKEWEETMSAAQTRQVVCAPCARYVCDSDSQLVDPSSIELTLLRNDNLPPHTRPTSYDFDVYERALLCPQGLSIG